MAPLSSGPSNYRSLRTHPDDLPLALTLGSTEGYICSGSLVAAHTAESDHAESSVGVAVAYSGVHEY
jgi:hypothetical protein